ncbi:hypothetical protein OCH239_22225 [Roseivivax halodurans JCM 10272]|uniref:Uncharacterized protein n=1 Tax=Roseivivax halodurans JCM 10272 TaxID=1449350 RepID=X7E5I1_9RHOB|nr:hypothetical protein [Roseivivax halodurans]ETX10411.1 hypothetical protein OCH239_22225 [Roseivivax halodurans JCM 10272]
MAADDLILAHQDKLARDLGRIWAWCSHIHPAGGPIALSAFVMWSHERVANGLAFQEASLHIVPIMELPAANAALTALGYHTQLSSPPRASWLTQIFSEPLSAHETLEAIRRFRAAGLG